MHIHNIFLKEELCYIYCFPSFDNLSFYFSNINPVYTQFLFSDSHHHRLLTMSLISAFSVFSSTFLTCNSITQCIYSPLFPETILYFSTATTLQFYYFSTPPHVHSCAYTLLIVVFKFSVYLTELSSAYSYHLLTEGRDESSSLTVFISFSSVCQFSGQ